MFTNILHAKNSVMKIHFHGPMRLKLDELLFKEILPVCGIAICPKGANIRPPK